MADAPLIRIHMLLCDSAQVSSGKLYILGGGWNNCSAGLTNMGVALNIIVPWDMSNRTFKWSLELFTEDNEPVLIGDPPTQPVILSGEFEVGRPPEWPRGMFLSVPLAMNATGIPLKHNKGYFWEFKLDGNAEERVSFFTRKSEGKE